MSPAELERYLAAHRRTVDRTLRALLKTREVAFGAGSYFSVWLDDAQLELGKVLRDDLHDYPGAVAAFRRLPADYPASILQDEALWETAVTFDVAGDPTSACKELAKLKKKWPDSKYELDLAPALAAKLGCSP